MCKCAVAQLLSRVRLCDPGKNTGVGSGVLQNTGVPVGSPGTPPGDLPDPGIKLPLRYFWILKVKMKVKPLSRVPLFVTPWTPGSSVHGIF